MIEIPVTALLGRIKGGGPDIAPKWFLDLNGKLISAYLFGFLCLLYYDWNIAVLMGFMWWIGNKPSMSEVVSAIGGYFGHWFQDRDAWVLDFLTSWIKNERIWGVATGILRGAYTGICLALPSQNPWFILAGALFPVCYFIGVSIEQFYMKKTQVSWHWGEWIWYGVIGAAI